MVSRGEKRVFYGVLKAAFKIMSLRISSVAAISKISLEYMDKVPIFASL
jgi:hypothetical protein